MVKVLPKLHKKPHSLELDTSCTSHSLQQSPEISSEPFSHVPQEQLYVTTIEDILNDSISSTLKKAKKTHNQQKQIQDTRPTQTFSRNLQSKQDDIEQGCTRGINEKKKKITTVCYNSCKWSKSQTELFYKMLGVYGTDFSLMCHSEAFKARRSKKELLNKYKKESRLNGEKIDEVLLRNNRQQKMFAVQEIEIKAENLFFQENVSKKNISVQYPIRPIHQHY